MPQLASFNSFELINCDGFEYQVHNGAAVSFLHQCLMAWFKHTTDVKSIDFNKNHTCTRHQILYFLLKWKKKSHQHQSDNLCLSSSFVRWHINTNFHHAKHDIPKLKHNKTMVHSEILTGAFSEWKHLYQARNTHNREIQIAEQPLTTLMMHLFAWADYADYKKSLKKSEKILEHVHNTNTCQYFFEIWLKKGMTKKIPHGVATIEPVLATSNKNLDCCVS